MSGEATLAALRPLTPAVVKAVLADMAARDPAISHALRRAGSPPMRARPPGFAALVRIICAQQVSTAAAATVSLRLQQAAGRLTPARVLALNPGDLRGVGLSHRKMEYVRGLAGAVVEGRLDIDGLARQDDEAAISELTRVRGIGRWTAEIYLLFALRRPDLWPVDDLAIAVALHRLTGGETRPTRAEMLAWGEQWRPWRSVVARLLWHFYNRAAAS